MIVTLDICQINNCVSWKCKNPSNAMNHPKQTLTKSTMTTVMLASSSVLLAQNLGTQFSQLKLTFSS